MFFCRCSAAIYCFYFSLPLSQSNWQKFEKLKQKFLFIWQIQLVLEESHFSLIIRCWVLSIWTVGCQKFVQYIRILWPGRFILVESVAKSSVANCWGQITSMIVTVTSKMRAWFLINQTFQHLFRTEKRVWLIERSFRSLSIIFKIESFLS